MEQLIKDLKELGYELVYDEFSGAWKVVDFLGSVNDYLPSAFSAVVFKNGFIFSCGIALDDRSLVVEFSKR